MEFNKRTFLYKFIARVTPCRGDLRLFKILFYMKYPYSTTFCELMSMNAGQTMDLSSFILRVTPGHLTKKAFSGRRMQLELTDLFVPAKNKVVRLV